MGEDQYVYTLYTCKHISLNKYLERESIYIERVGQSASLKSPCGLQGEKAAPGASPAVFLPSTIAECSARFPKVSLSFVEGPVEELIQKLESGELDLALMYETGLPNGLISTPVKEGHPYIILPDGHPMLRH